MHAIFLGLAALLTMGTSTIAQQMHLARNYSGTALCIPPAHSSFLPHVLSSPPSLDLWNYKVGNDVINFWGDPSNNGVVNFTDPVFAQEQKLLFVNDAGNVIVRTDNFTDGTGNSSFVRNSLQLLSKDPITPGTLMIMDAVHMPFGCAVWPAFWMNGGANWPTLGEIDIVENVNLATTNAYNLHTTQGCMASTNVKITGDLVHLDCFNGTDHDTGCKVVDTELSYGAGFAGNGGGAFVFLWNNDGMKIWFFPRPSVPSDMASANPNPDGWGTPTAFYPMSTCDMPRFFGLQTMILEINVCGNFAVDKFADTCSAVAAKCTDIVPVASTFDNAFFEIKYITVFSNDTSLIASTSSAAGTSTTAGVSSSTGGSTSVSTSAQANNPSSSTTSGGTSLQFCFPVFAFVALMIYVGL